MRRIATAVLLVVAFGVGCGGAALRASDEEGSVVTEASARTAPPSPRPASRMAPPAAAPAAPEPRRDEGLAPLEVAPTVDVALAGGEPALISPPRGATAPQPVLVATHGAGGRAEYHCALWRRMLGPERGFVLCPRGFPMNRRDTHTGYFYDGHPALGREMAAALSALSERFGPYVDVERPVFAGYSQGASMGALVLPSHEARFTRAVLWEGGVGAHQEWNVVMAERFAERGGERVLMACGRPQCSAPARTTAGYFRRAGLKVKLVDVPGAGHTAGGRLAAAVDEAFPWLLEGDPRW